MKAVKETETEGATPEQLLQIIDRELALKRSHRGVSSRNRAMILVVGILFIVVAAGAALLILDQMANDLRHNGPASTKSEDRLPTNF